VQVSLPPDVPEGFLDQTMRGGMEWTVELTRAVGTCQVLVALLSAPYLESQWCWSEWWAFEQRAVRSLPGKTAPPRSGCIIPVLWAPLRAALPGRISSRQIFSPDLEPDPKVPAQYEENGIFGLMRMGEPDNSYQIVAWQLSRLIADIYQSQLTEPREFDPVELRNCLPG
jgi:hypothetical protein